MLALSALGGLQAQDPAGKVVKVRFRVLGWDDAATDLNYPKGSSDEKLVIAQGNRSVFYEYTGPSKISFYRLKKGDDGQMIKDIAVQADLGEAGPWPLILLAKRPAKPGTYDAMVLKDDLASFPPGTYEFANFTNTVISGSLGPKSFSLPPKGISVIEGRPQGDSTTVFVSLTMQKGSEKVPLYTNNWAHQTTSRTVVFVIPSAETPTGVAARRLMESTQFPPENKNAASTAPR